MILIEQHLKIIGGYMESSKRQFGEWIVSVKYNDKGHYISMYNNRTDIEFIFPHHPNMGEVLLKYGNEEESFDYMNQRRYLGRLEPIYD